LKLATIQNGTRDGQLLVVSKDLTKAIKAADIAINMMDAIERWHEVEAPLNTLYQQLNSGSVKGEFAFDQTATMSPFPRSNQFIDASAFLNHGNIMEEAFDLDIDKDNSIPILLQRQSDDFLGSHQDYPFPSIDDNADFEGEFAVVVDDTPMGLSENDVEKHIKLVMIMNDVSMRAHLFRELSAGFGFIQAKPATVFGPVAVTPDELGDEWRDGRIHLDMCVERNGEWFGNPNGGQMDFSFGHLLSHLSYNRNLKAGCILGTGTVSNSNYKEVGSACLAERRALELIEFGESKSPFLQNGECLKFEVFDKEGQSIFGKIEHKFVLA